VEGSAIVTPTNDSKRHRVHWFNWQPTPYNDYLFVHLSQQPDIELTVIYRSRLLQSHPWKSNLATGYPCRYYRLFGGVDWHALRLAIWDRNSLFVVAGWDHRTIILLLSLLRLLRRKYALWTDTPDLQKQRRRAKAVLRSAWLKWVLGGARSVLATGKCGVDAVVQMGVPAERARSFPFWLDLEQFRRPYPIVSGHEKLRFLSSGRLDNTLKGHDLALRSLSKALKDRAVSWEYVIAGSGRDLEPLQQLSEELGIRENVVFAGWVEPPELIRLYRTSDAVLHPSPTHDPFPNAVLEGMAASCIVFASNACGSGLDRIQSGVNGFLHQAGNWEELAGQISQIAEDPSRRNELGRQARATAELWPIQRAIDIVREMVSSVN